jgi:two-component sensor histidine kinase
VEADAFMGAESRELVLRQADSRRDAQSALRAARVAMVAMFAAVAVQLWQWRLRRREMMSRAAELEAEVAARTEALNREKMRVEALLADVNHRVGNDLAAVSVLLATQARRSGLAEVKAALAEAQDRVRMIAEAQRRLRLDVGTDTVRAGHVLGPAIDMLAERLAPGGIEVESEIADVPMPGRDALSLVIIVNELVTNAAKHAFPDGFSGPKRVLVSLAEVGGGLELAVADSGVGYRGGAKGMGTNVVASLARGMGGAVRRNEVGQGTRVVVAIDAE